MQKETTRPAEPKEKMVLEPFNPESISINRKPLTITNILNRLKRKTITLAPPYQRKEVWTIEQKSQLIESLMLKFPLPSFYAAEDDVGNYEVVDGLQRLAAIRDFMFPKGDITKEITGKGFKLQGLEYLTEYEGSQFHQLSDYFQQNIEENNLEFIVIDNKAPEDVKFVIFSRINRGGQALNDQEVRHALYNGPASTLLEEFSEQEIFIKNFSEYFDTQIMLDREVILRMIAFMIRDYGYYVKRNLSMNNFLNDTMLIINSMPDFTSHRFIRKFGNNEQKFIKINNINKIRTMFSIGLERAIQLFGKHTFRKSFGNDKRNRINKALFETWGATLASLDQDIFETLHLNKSIFLAEYHEKILFSPSFSRAISNSALTPQGVEQRYSAIKKLITRHTHANSIKY